MEEKLNNNSKQANKNVKKEKQEPSEKVKKRKAKIAVVSLCTIVVLLVGLQVYASTNGYGNIFFMIRNLITTGNLAGVQEIFSDKDITLSYKSIDLAEGLKIQANRLEIKDGKSKLYLSVKGQNINLLPLKYEISSKSNNGNETTTTTKTTGNKPESTDSFSYEEILTLDYAVDENKTIILKISDTSDKELKTLEINLQTREITVKGEKEFEKISEIELKKYLNLFSELNNDSGKENVLIYIAQSFQDNYKEFMKEEDYQYRMDKSTDRAYKNAIIKEFYGENAKFEYVNQKDASLPKVEVLKGITAWQYNKENDSYQPITAGEEYRHGTCLKIEDISYENNIYTVKYIYLLSTGMDEDADRLEELPQYETTIKLKRDEDNLYSKYQIVSLENGNEIKDKVSTKVEENENIFQDASKLKYTSNFKDSQNGKIAILKLGENEFKTIQKNGYYIYTDMYNNSYNIKKITDIISKFEMTNKDNNIALFRCTIYYIDNNNNNKTFDVAVTVPNNFEGVFIPGNYISYTGSTSFTRAFGVYSDQNITNDITSDEQNNRIQYEPDNYAEMVRIDDAYEKIIDNMSKTKEYRCARVDIDNDGVHELIIVRGDYEAEKEISYYTYQNGEVKSIGTFSFGHSCLYKMNNQNYLLQTYGHMGSEEISKVYIKNGKIQRDVISTREVAENEAYTEGDALLQELIY